LTSRARLTRIHVTGKPIHIGYGTRVAGSEANDMIARTWCGVIRTADGPAYLDLVAYLSDRDRHADHREALGEADG